MSRVCLFAWPYVLRGSYYFKVCFWLEWTLNDHLTLYFQMKNSQIFILRITLPAKNGLALLLPCWTKWKRIKRESGWRVVWTTCPSRHSTYKQSTKRQRRCSTSALDRPQVFFYFLNIKRVHCGSFRLWSVKYRGEIYLRWWENFICRKAESVSRLNFKLTFDLNWKLLFF